MVPQTSFDERQRGRIVYLNQAKTGQPLKCLWVSRDLPFPQDAGDRIYSANMVQAFADAGAQVRFLCYGKITQKTWSPWLRGSVGSNLIETRVLSARKRSSSSALFSHLPIAAAIHATNDYRTLLTRELGDAWDVIVLDSYGSGWALETCLAACETARLAGQPAPTLVYLSHNHEESIWRSMSEQSRANPIKRIALWQNYWKVRALERRVVDAVDLVTAITAEDARTYSQQAPDRATVVLTPGYSGWVAPPRKITPNTPRNVVLVGSFRWVVKQENLRRFLELSDARFADHDITFNVIGDVPEALLNELRPSLKATRFLGFVDDIGAHFAAARIAVVPELIGGGFKLKYLDYLFGRVPIATISEAAAGLAPEIRDEMFCRPDLPRLVDAIIDNIDHVDQLNVMQEQAFVAARTLFDWSDRGHALRQALETHRHRLHRTADADANGRAAAEIVPAMRKSTRTSRVGGISESPT